MFWLKLLILLCFCVASIYTSVFFTDSYVAQTTQKQKSLADAIAQTKLQQALKEAEDKAKAELEQNQITIVTEVVTTKPPVTEPPVTTTEPLETTTVPTTVETEIITNIEKPERITEFKRGGLLPADRTFVKRKTIVTLTAKESDQMMIYLAEHYFLDGYMYADAEQDEEYKERKLLAAQMQGYLTQSVDMLTGFFNTGDLAAILNSDFNGAVKSVENLKAEFIEKFSGVSEYGTEFANIYEQEIKYFDRLIAAFKRLKATADDYNNAANPLMAGIILAGAVDNVLLPEITGTLESSFGITELFQDVFLEGTQGTHLLTRGEVAEIFQNPGLIL